MSQIGKYRLSERIGAGAMGEVYRAHDTVLDRPVALKVIIGGDDDKRQRFRREAQSAARLAHPNIVTVHDFFEHHGVPYIAHCVPSRKRTGGALPSTYADDSSSAPAM